jgi:alkanesulfonate monooxygenase
MSLRFHWFLPTSGDGREIVGGGHGAARGVADAVRPASLAYLGQIARSAEQLGFEAALTPAGAWCEDAWLTTAMLTEVTERLKFLVASRPGLISPTLSAPHLEEAYWFGEGVLPLLRARGLWQHPAPGSADATGNTMPFGPASNTPATTAQAAAS